MPQFQELHIHLVQNPGQDKVNLHYSIPADKFTSENRTLDLKEVTDKIKLSEHHYYSYLPGDYLAIGKQLYHWLDGNDRFLERAIQKLPTDQLLVLAFKGAAQLLHLPWELLHNGSQYLVRQYGPEILPVRLQEGRTTPREPQKRALELLFMATSPIGVKPRLPFEKEEARILEATKKLPLELEVEESGNLEQLKLLYNQLGESQIDVVHISGHATNEGKEPYFLAEDEFGQLHKATADDFIQTFPNRKPSLLFLSGCQTGGAQKEGSVPSLAGRLVDRGFPAILAWAKPVLDRTATEAATHLYKALAEGSSLPQALHRTLNTLMKDERKFRDWHLLRLYTYGSIPDNLILPGRHRKRRRTAITQFLDPERRIKVPDRQSFIGRRRKLQACLSVLRNEPDKYGVVVHGMGGLGKSSLAARVCDRLNIFYKPVVWVGKLSESYLLQKLNEGLDEFGKSALNNPNLEGPFLLKSAFEQDRQVKQLLFVLDDFEQNFEMNENGEIEIIDGLPRLNPQAAQILKDLIKALELYEADDQAPKLFITSRYKFETQESRFLEFIGLNAFEEGEKERLEANKGLFEIADSELRTRIQKVSDGNPRLLEQLIEVIKTSTGDAKELLDLLEEKSIEFREQIFAQYIFDQMPEDTQKLIQALSVFEVPVPIEVVEKLADVEGGERKIQVAVDLSLVEDNGTVFEKRPHFRISEIIKSLLPENTIETYYEASSFLSENWINVKYETQLKELTRIGLLGENKTVLEEFGVEYVRRLESQQRYKEAQNIGNAILEVIDNHPKLLLYLGRTEKLLGHTTNALGYFQRGQESTDDEKLKSNFVYESAKIFLQYGQVDKALQLYQQALDILERIGDEQGKSATFHEMAYIFLQRGQVDKALQLYQQALDILERIGDEQGKSATFHEMAYIFLQRGQVDKALQLYQQALDIKERIGDEKGKSATFHSMAYIFLQRGQVDKALQLYQQALDIKERIGDKYGQANTLIMLAQLLSEEKQQFAEAWELAKQSLQIYGEIGAKENLDTIQSIAYRILIAKLQHELPPAQFQTFQQKLQNDEDVFAWLREQGIDF